jgi:hypothetical protein
MWDALKEASEQPGVAVRVYVDADKGDPAGVKARLPRATVYRSAQLPDGRVVVSHTKFIVVDDELVRELLLQRRQPQHRIRAPHSRQRACRVDRIDDGQQARNLVRACMSKER